MDSTPLLDVSTYSARENSREFKTTVGERVYDSLYPHLTTKTQQQIAAIINIPKPKIQLEFIDVQNQSSFVPRPSAPRPFGKLEREKWKEGLVNGLTTACSSAGMLAELIIKANCIFVETEKWRSPVYNDLSSFLSTDWAKKAWSPSKKQ